MSCDSRQLTQAQLEAGFQNQRTGVTQAIRPFSGQATPESLADYLNREVFPVLKQARAKLNEVFLQVTDNAPSGNPLAFYFSTETGAADPTVGRIRLDNATQNTATTIRVSQSNGRRVDVTPWLDVMAGGATSPLGVVTLLDTVNPGRFIRFDLDSMTDQGDYWDLAVTPVESSHPNPFVDGEGIVVSFTPGVSSAGSTVPVGSLGDLAGLSMLGRAGNTSGAMAAITATTADHVARVNAAGTSLEWGQCTTGSYADRSVTAPKMFAVNARSVVCKATTGNGDAEMLTIASNGILVRNGAGDLASLQLGGNCVVGRLGSGNPTIIQSSNANQLLLRGSGSILFADVLDNSVVGRVGSSTLAGGIVQNQNSFYARVGGDLVSHPFATFAGAGLDYLAGVMSVDFSSVTYTAGDGIDLTGLSFSVDVTDLLADATIEEVATNNIRRAAITGDVSIPAGSNTSAIGSGVIVNANVNASAAIDMTKTGALTGDVTKASGSSTTAIAAGVIVDADVNASAAIALTKTGALTGDVTKASGSSVSVLAAGAVDTTHLDESGALPGDGFLFDGANWVRQQPNVGMFEDFLTFDTGYLSGNGAVGSYRWTNAIGDAGGVWAGKVGEPGHPGIVRGSLTATGVIAFSTAGGSAVGGFGVNQICLGDVQWMRIVCRIAQTSSSTELSAALYGVGLVAESDATAWTGNNPPLGGDALVLHKPTAGTSTFWRARRLTAASASNLVSTHTAVAGVWIDASFVRESAGTYRLRIGGVDHGTITGVSTTAMVHASMGMQNTDASDKSFDVDLFHVGLDPLSARV